MASGGKRIGAGRKRGSRNKRSDVDIVAAKADGLLPHEILLEIARGKSVTGLKKPTRAEILEAAGKAAPFYAPRLSAIAAKVNQPGNPWDEILKAVDGKTRGLPSSGTQPSD